MLLCQKSVSFRQESVSSPLCASMPTSRPEWILRLAKGCSQQADHGVLRRLLRGLADARRAKRLRDVAEKSPRDFVRAAAMLMPKEFEIKSPLNELTDADLADLITAVQSLIAGGVAFPAAGGDRPATKPH